MTLKQPSSPWPRRSTCSVGFAASEMYSSTAPVNGPACGGVDCTSTAGKSPAPGGENVTVSCPEAPGSPTVHGVAGACTAQAAAPAPLSDTEVITSGRSDFGSSPVLVTAMPALREVPGTAGRLPI